MKRKQKIIAGLLLVGLIIAACTQAAPSETAKDVNIALVIAQGGLGDRSYNDLAYEGFERAMKDFDFNGKAIESEDPVGEGEKMLRQAAESGFNLVITLEYSHFEALDRLAPDYPDTLFNIVNIFVDQPNVVGTLFKEQEGSFLVGALAAMVTTMEGNDKINPEKIIGAVPGVENAAMQKFYGGYEEGAKYIDPDIEVLISFSNAFGDPAKGRELALAQYEQGADIVYQIAGGTGEGVFVAAEEKNRYAIGVDSDQDFIKPGFILTSMMKRVDNAVYDVIKRFMEGTLEGGTYLEYGLAENGVGISPMEFTKDVIPQEFLDRIEDIKQKILDGEIVPTDPTKLGAG